MAAKIRLKIALRTDKRIKFMNEIIQGVQVLKMYCWEFIFGKSVQQVRAKELNAIKESFFIKAALLSFHVLPQISIFLSFVFYAYYNEDPITSKKAFMVIAYFNALKQSLVNFWPLAISSVAEGYVSCKRVEKFLLTSETKEIHVGVIPKLENSQIHKVFETRTLSQNMNKPACITLKEATAYWTNDGTSSVGIQSIDIKITAPQLTIMIGPVGSGKSTLLQVLLGELELDYGQVEINRTMSYAAQESWLFDASVKKNILFNEEYDEERYKQILHVCALNDDLLQLAHGDETIVGEKGTSLSGGQKARLNLARAVYKKADIYLFDDPLSALDAKVGKFIFEYCIKGFLKDKLCLLVTHQMQYLSQADHVIVMNRGKLVAQGTYESVLNDESLLNSDIIAFNPSQVEQEDEDENIDEKTKVVEGEKDINHDIKKVCFF